MRITVEPTPEFFKAGDVMVRLWKGTDDNGAEVIALITGVRLASDRDDSGLVSIPAPTGQDARRWAADVLSRRYHPE